MKKHLLIFGAVLLLLFTLELLRPVQSSVIVPWTQWLAQVSGMLTGLFDGDVAVQGRLLFHRTTGNGVSIEAGCNGVEACLMLVAAMLAYPATWRQRLAGVAIGIMAVQAMNVLRIITLFYLQGWDADLFRFAHLYLWQVLIILDVLIVWLLWLRQIRRPPAQRVADA